MPPLIQLALVVETRRVALSEIKGVTAAVQRQLSRDFRPIWGIEATMDSFLSLEEVPPGYWSILVRDEFPGTPVVGIHLDRDNQPFALVRLSPTWSLTVSHEAMEMVADPWGNRLMPGNSPMRGQGLVDILVEICDPVGGVAQAYTVNGHLVSDFYTPHFFDPVASPGVRYSFTGRLTRPRHILPGGYMAWREPTSGDWWRWDWIRRRTPAFGRLGVLPADGRSLRERIDADATMPELFTGAPPDHPNVVAARERRASTLAASRARAGAVRARIDELFVRPGAGPQADDPPPIILDGNSPPPPLP
jgi:hypothetical protein